MTMFLMKKCITPFLLPPGVFVVLLLGTATWLARRKNWKGVLLVGVPALFLWLVAADPVANRLMLGLESGLKMPRAVTGDVIILLGGGVIEGVEDLTGSGAPTDGMMARIVTAVRAQRMLRVPIIVSGGAVFATKPPEAYVVKRFLCDLGVPKEMVIVEDKSRDTDENARFAGEISARHGFRNPVLITSASHMRRAVSSFVRRKIQVVPLPVNLLSRQRQNYIWMDYLPSSGALLRSSTALHEYFGLLFQRLTL